MFALRTSDMSSIGAPTNRRISAREIDSSAWFGAAFCDGEAGFTAGGSAKTFASDKKRQIISVANCWSIKPITMTPTKAWKGSLITADVFLTAILPIGARRCERSILLNLYAPSSSLRTSF